MQLMPLQHLDVHLLQIETARQHPGDLAVALHACPDWPSNSTTPRYSLYSMAPSDCAMKWV